MIVHACGACACVRVRTLACVPVHVCKREIERERERGAGKSSTIQLMSAAHAANLFQDKVSGWERADGVSSLEPRPSSAPDLRPSRRGPGKTAGHIWPFTPITSDYRVWINVLSLSCGLNFNSGFLAWIIAYRSLSAIEQRLKTPEVCSKASCL